MLVVPLGPLLSFTADLYEAARVDGATRWQQFKSITLPSLRPALVPAVIISVVWTFNMFNIIYLVTGGGAGSATPDLGTQADKVFFQRHPHRLAPAHSTGVFRHPLLFRTHPKPGFPATEA